MTISLVSVLFETEDLFGPPKKDELDPEYNKMKLMVSSGLRKIVKIIKKVLPEIKDDLFSAIAKPNYISGWSGEYKREHSSNTLSLRINLIPSLDFVVIEQATTTMVGDKTKTWHQNIHVSKTTLSNYFNDGVTHAQFASKFTKSITTNESILLGDFESLAPLVPDEIKQRHVSVRRW